MPPRHSPHPHHGPEWLVSVHDDELRREDYAKHLTAIGDVLSSSAILEIADTEITIPDSVEFVLRFERTPEGHFALLIKAEWPESRSETASITTARGLVIRAPRVENGRRP